MAIKLSVAFIGTGIMGAPIAGHILDAGYPVTVNNRTKSKAAALVERGAVWADTPADAAANADVVFTMVGYPSEVEELYLAGDGLLACTKPGAVLIDLTTSSPELARDIAEAAQVSGRMAFDCPVTGGESGAIAGTLTAIVGATENDIAPVRDILSTFAATICCFDGAGKGQAAKLANQVSLGACMVGMADAMAFAELSGLDLEKTRQMILGGTGKSGAMESLAPKALDGDYKPGFMVEHFIKDLRLALAYADDRELALPGADVAFTLYDMLDAIGGAKLGTQAITVLYKEEADAIGRKMLEKVGLADRADYYPRQLSGGQQQRVAIARALATDPEIIYFDEPTSALDPELTGEVLAVMRQLAEEGMTMLVVTHEMGFARNVSSKTVFMENGVVVEQAPSREFFEEPKEERTREFLRKIEHTN